MIAERIRRGAVPTLYWAVPISSAAPHVAHLLLQREKGSMTAKLCKQSMIINRNAARAVDSERYEPKCLICRAMRRSLGKRVTVTEHTGLTRITETRA